MGLKDIKGKIKMKKGNEKVNSKIDKDTIELILRLYEIEKEVIDPSIKISLFSSHTGKIPFFAGYLNTAFTTCFLTPPYNKPTSKFYLNPLIISKTKISRYFSIVQIFNQIHWLCILIKKLFC